MYGLGVKGTVPILAGPRCIGRVDMISAERIAGAINARPVRQRKTGLLMEIQLLEYGDDSRIPTKWNNPFTTSTQAESDDNPPHVWTLKRVQAPRGHGREQALAGTVIS